MTIRFSCSGCRAPFRVEDDKAGKKTKCPVCRTVLIIPSKSVEPRPVACNPAGVLSDDEIFRILEELRKDPEPTVPSPSSPTEDTAIGNAPLSKTPTSMPPVTRQDVTSNQASSSISAAEAAESMIKKMRKARRHQ